MRRLKTLIIGILLTGGGFRRASADSASSGEASREACNEGRRSLRRRTASYRAEVGGRARSESGAARSV